MFIINLIFRGCLISAPKFPQGLNLRTCCLQMWLLSFFCFFFNGQQSFFIIHVETEPRSAPMTGWTLTVMASTKGCWGLWVAGTYFKRFRNYLLTREIIVVSEEPLQNSPINNMYLTCF